MNKPNSHTGLDFLDRESDCSLFKKLSDTVLPTSYALVITSGSAPSASLDTSFMDSLGLQGYTGASGRGTVSGSYSGTLSGPAVTIGFKVCAII